MQFKNEKMEAMIDIIILFVFSLTPLLWLHGNEVILGHDSGFRINAVEHMKNFLFGWNPYINFGMDWSLYHGFIPIQVIETIFSFIFSSLSIGERMTFISWFFSIGLSMYVFVRYFFPEKKFFPLWLLGPVYWMYNLYMLSAWAIAERAKFSLYIALPLMIVIFFKTIEKDWSLLKGGILFGLLFFFFNGGGSPPLYGGIIVTCILLGVYFLFLSPAKYGIRLLGVVGVFVLWFVLLNAYWVLPQLRLLIGSYTSAVSARGGIEGLIAWEHEVSKHASISNILRLWGFPDWFDNPEHPYGNIYLNNTILSFVSFLPIVTTGLGLLLMGLRKVVGRQKKILVFLLALGVVGLFFTTGSHPPSGVIYLYLMRHVPGFAIFRSGFYKFAPTVYLPIIIFFGYYLSELLSNSKLQKFAQYIFVLVVALGIAFYHFPYFTGNLFSFKGGFSTRVTVPSYVTDMMGILGAKTTVQDRILLVPPLDVGFINSPIDTYTWGFYSLDILPRVGINRSFLANDSNDDAVTRLLYKTIESGDEKTFLHLSEAAGITNILWRGDVRLSSGTEKKMPLSFWEQKLAEFSSVHLLSTSGLWKLYEVRSNVTPMVYAANSVTFVQKGSTDDAYIIGKGMSDQRDALLRASDDVYEKEASLASGLYREVECFFCKSNEYSKLVEAIYLPTVRTYILPFLNDRLTRKEKEAIEVSKGSPNEIDAQLSAAAARLSEIMTKKDAGSGNIQKYQGHLARITEILGALYGREKDFYSNRVMAHLDAQLRDIKGVDDTQNVIKTIEDTQKAILPYIWMADKDVYRFGVTLPSDGDYTLWMPDASVYTKQVEIDGKIDSFNSKIKLAAGYHRFALTPLDIRDAMDEIVSPVFLYSQHEPTYTKVPSVSFVQKNPTLYEVAVTGAQSPFVLVLNQRFDPGWGLAIKGVRQGYYHQEANGFANSWIVPKTGDFMLTLYYIPQQLEYVGGLITIVTFVAAVGYGAMMIRRKQRV
ncbi:MAG: hypothetical protein AAB481_04815 [Patescibacteria group bacterium]